MSVGASECRARLSGRGGGLNLSTIEKLSEEKKDPSQHSFAIFRKNMFPLTNEMGPTTPQDVQEVEARRGIKRSIVDLLMPPRKWQVATVPLMKTT